MKQGDNLSPSLFSAYINDLLKCIKDSNIGVKVRDLKVGVLAYADDLVLILPTQAGLQQLINQVARWCKKNRLQVNIDKSKVMHVRTRNLPQTTYNFTYNSTCLAKVEKYKYLGFIINSSLTPHDGCDSLVKAGERALGSLINKTKKTGEVGYATFSKLFNTCVVPILDYCGGIWGVNAKNLNRLKMVDKVQDRALRFFLGVSKTTTKLGIKGDIPWLSSQRR